MVKDCRILRIERSGKYLGIVNFLDKLLRENPSWGNQRLSTAVSKEYHIDVSRSAIRSYRSIMQQNEDNITEESTQQYSDYYCKVSSYRKHRKKKSDYADRAIRYALS